MALLEPSTITILVLTGIFSSSIIFLISAGLQIVFGIQRILNLTVGSFYAIGAYVGITFINFFLKMGFSVVYGLLFLILAGLSLSFLGPTIERGVLNFVYKKEEAFQLLATFGLVLIFEDMIKLIWGSYPQISDFGILTYGEFRFLDTSFPVYYFLVIISAFLIAFLLEFFIKKTRQGKKMRSVADDIEMSEGLGVKVRNIYILSFTIGTVLGTLAGALIIPVTAAVLGMGIEAIVLAFAVVVIAGLGSMRGALLASLIVGLLQAFITFIFPELTTFVIYLIVIAVLLIKPTGLMGKEI
ncbi:MAG: branched-chain amino acid ABC transporter permease [Nitrososphaerales archaeon]